MVQTPIKFRCYRCNQPLGAPARKAGAVVNCPQCGSELKIPAPDAPPADPAPPPPLDISTLRPEDIRVEPEFANIVVTPPRPAPEPLGPAPTPTETITLETRDEVVIPTIRVEPPPIAARAAPGRGVREVVLSPAVVLAWSLLALLAVPLAFLAGLLTGHFLWK